MLCTQPTHRGLARGLGAFRSDTPARPPAPVTGRRWQTGWWRQSLHALWPRPRPPRILTAASRNSLYRTGGRRRCTADNLNAAELGATGAEAHCVRRVRAASGRRPATKWGARGGGVRAGGARAVAAWAKEPWWCDGGSSCLRWKVTSDAAAGVCYAHLHGRGLWRRGRYVLTCSRRGTSQHRACARGSLRC